MYKMLTKSPTNCEEAASGKILPSKEVYTKTKGMEGNLQEAGSRLSVKQVKKQPGVFLPPQLCFWQRWEGEVPDPTKR